MIDIQEKKNKIISFLGTNGPSLPVQVARAIQMEPVFASAILSELLGAKQIKLSHLRVGSSPLYLVPGEEQKLEKQIENLKPAEKEAYLKLKENKTLTDEGQEPAIRVALRNIKDFAIPFKEQDKIMWKYAFTTEEEEPEEETLEPEKKTTVPTELTTNNQEPRTKPIEPIFKKSEQPATQRTFLKEIEEFLEKQNIQITSIQEVDKKNVIAKIHNAQDALLFAFNKQRISEQELMKAYKQANAQNLPYHIIIRGDLTKKMDQTIDAYKKLLKVDKLDN